MTEEKSDPGFGIDQPETPLMVPPANRPTPREAQAAEGADDDVQLIAEVVNRLVDIEEKLKVLDVIKVDVQQLHALLLGIPDPEVVPLVQTREVHGGPSKIGGIGQVFHKWNNVLSNIVGNTDQLLACAERMEITHEKYANEVARVHQENVILRLDVERLKAIAALKLINADLATPGG